MSTGGGEHDVQSESVRPVSRAGAGERVRGIEPPLSAWEADVLPLNYTRGDALACEDREPPTAASISEELTRVVRRGGARAALWYYQQGRRLGCPECRAKSGRSTPGRPHAP